MRSKKTTKFLHYSMTLSAIVIVSLVVFFTHLGLTYPDYSGLYQADCSAPSCSFELHSITSSEYLLKYLGEEVKMSRFIDSSNKTYLLNTTALLGTTFAIATIWLDNLDKGHTQWQGRTYYKIGTP